MNSSGSLRLYLGCMFSGKTSELIREYTRYKKIGKKVICINYSFDNRYGEDDYVYSHDLNKIECLKAQKLMSLNIEDVLKYDVILINEGQFFEDIMEFCQLYCDIYSKHIIICALDGDFMRKPFGKISELVPMADEITKLKAFCTECNDGTPAIFTWRLSKDVEQISINNDYIPVCRKHYLILSNKTLNNIKEEKNKDTSKNAIESNSYDSKKVQEINFFI
jgi:thymidine kinase